MAKNPRKAQDPTQAALSAIEEALQIGEDPAKEPAPKDKLATPEEARRPLRDPSSLPSPQAASAIVDENPVARRRVSGRRIERMTHAPANDDRQSVGQILAALHTRPSRMPYYVAAIASAWWIVMALLIGYSRSYQDIAKTTGLLDIVDLPYFWLFFATLVLPPIMFFGFAALIRRTQEMRFVSRAMTEVTLRLAEPEGISTDAIVSVSQAIRREVAALGDGIERAIARASELETMVRNEVSTLERAYDENELRVRALVDELQSERDAIVSHGTRLREAIGGAHESFSFDVEGVASRIDSNLTEATERINASLAEAGSRVTDNFVSAAENARLQVAETGDRFTENFASVAENARLQVAEVGDRVTGDFASLAESTRLQVADASNIVLDMFAGRSNEFAERLTQVGIEVANALDSRAARLTEGLNHSVERITESMNTSMERVTESISIKGNEVHDILTVRLTAAEDGIARNGNEIADRIAAESAALARRLTESLQGFDNTVKVHGSGLLEQMTQTVDHISQHTTATLANLNDHTSSTLANLTEHSSTALVNFDERVAGKMRETTEAIDARIHRIEQTIDSRTQNLNETLAGRTLDLARTISDGARLASEAVDKTVAGMGEYFASKAQEIAVTISDRAEAVDQTLGRRALEMTETLDSRIDRFEDQVTNRLAGIAESIETRGIALTDSLVTKLDSASGELVSKVNEVSSELVSKVDHVSGELVSKVDRVSGELVSKVDQVSGSLVVRLNETSGSLVTHLDETSSSLVGKIGQVSTNLRQEAAEVERTLNQLGDEMTKTLVERTGEAVRGFAEQTHQIAATHEALRENVVGSLDKLIESNRLFKQLLQGVTESLDPLENAMSKRVASLQGAFESTVTSTRSTVDWIDNQMNELRGIANGVLRDLSAVTQRFEGQGRYIASVAETLSETHGRIDQSLEERRETIEHIIRLLVERTAAIEENFGDRSQQIGERLAAFNRLLQESLTAAEERAQEIGRHIVDSTNTISQTINKQHETIRSGYSEERGRTATALKSTYEEAMGEMKQMFTELQDRFSETARQVREVAGEVQSSLEQTRVELKRGVLELPHETRESAEAMRRVVSDQLKALGELNEIVSRHARDMELVEPHRMLQREETAAAGARYGNHGETASVTDMAAVARQRAAAPRGEPIEFRRPRQNAAVDPRQPAQREALAPARGEREARDDRERGGWLSDMLTRAEDARSDGSPAQTIESLDSLSLDIARMIDHDAAVDLWDRHQRGERNIFTRRLYTPQGQKTFDEIRNRYRKSNEFRETVDRYIDEFERLLEQVSRDDRGQVLSKTYLTSDTGKVYTLLAHAAARLN